MKEEDTASLNGQSLGVAPSEIDEKAETACPSFLREERTFSSVYARQHAQTVAYLAAKLQERFDDTLVEEETPLTSGARGIVDLRFIMRDSHILVEEDERILCILEVKTSSVKICQPSYYAAAEGIPVLLIEAKTGDVFLITPEGGRRYLDIVRDLFRSKSVLKDKGILCPGRYCRYCANTSCVHHRDRGEDRQEVNLLLEENFRSFRRNLPRVVEKVSKFIQGLLEEDPQRAPQLPETSRREER